MKHSVVNMNNVVVGEIELLEGIFGAQERPDILHRVVHWQLAKRRSGNHQTKTISMVQGSTRKPFRQKGTGRARQGTIRAPQHRGGAVVFGPHVRSYAYALPKKIRAMGLRVALSSKMRSGNLVILDNISLADGKTKTLLDVVQKNGWKSALFVDAGINQGFSRASSNIIHVDILPHYGLNVYSILQREKLIISQDAIYHLEARLKS